MGTDNLFHKRKAKNAASLARRKARREPYKKVLIVSEGEKTEPNYFNDLKDYYGLNSANVEICGECGSDPLSIVEHAKQRYREGRDAGDPFDYVFCVFDKDAHVNYQTAIDQIERATPKNTFCNIISVPCFEYWLLLHYVYTTRPYEALPGNSSCGQLIEDLKDYMPDYEKGNNGLFTSLIGQLDFAKSNAIRSLQAAHENHTDNPKTNIHELVEFLQNIKQ